MELNDILQNVKNASKKMATSSQIEKKKLLENIALKLDERREEIKAKRGGIKSDNQI